MNTKLLFLSVLSFFYLFTIASNAPMKYGKPEIAELQMTTYAPDTSASAVVLCNYGYFDSQQFQFVHQMRIKILKESGKNEGNFYVPADEKASVKGQVVNLENGKPVVTKLAKEGIFIERVTRNNYRARVAMPNVKAGSVIDVEFFFQGIPYYWEFQKHIPIKWSELNIESNIYVTLRKNVTGYIPFAISTDERWATSEVPAFVPESYINNPENYLSRMQIEIQQIHIPGGLYRDYATTWEAVAKTLQQHNEFGMQLSNINLYMNDVEREIKKSTENPQLRMHKAFEALKKFKWNNKSSIWPSETGIAYAYSKKNGNCADINMSLVILLRKLGINANPVLLSTRDNGLLPMFSVSFDKLNYMVVHANINDTTYLMDATEEYLPINMLPERALNGKAIMIKKDSYELLDLAPEKKNRLQDVYTCTLSEDGVIKGNRMLVYNDYAAFDNRENYKSFNSEEEYLKSVESETKGLSIETYSKTNLDSIELPFIEKMDFILKNKAIKNGNQLFINPFLFEKFDENPFKAIERMYPVDFTTPMDAKTAISIIIPKGWEIAELPKSVRLTLTDKSAAITYAISSTENNIQLSFRLTINKPIYIQSEYSELKLFFDALVKKQNELIVLRKI